MKFLKHTETAVLLFFVFASCTPRNTPDPGFTAMAPISFTGSTEDPASRTTLRDETRTYWKGGSDQIGMFSAQGRTSQGGTPPAYNVPFTAQNSASSSAFTGSMYWGEAGAEHTFYAYYPYDSGYSGGPTAVPVSLSSVQFQSGANNSSHIGPLDFMVGGAVKVNAPGTPGQVAEAVGLTFHHVFALIEFRITGSGEQLSRVDLWGSHPLGFSGGTIDITQDPGAGNYTITDKVSTSTKMSVTFISPITLSTTPVSVFMMILPGTQETSRIEITSNGTLKTLTKTPPAGGFMRGQKYVVTLDEGDFETAT
jgi:hypothetical protein